MNKRSVIIFSILLSILAALAGLNLYLYKLQEDKRETIESLQLQVGLHEDENKVLTERNLILQDSVDVLRSPDSFYAYEEKAREDYGMIGNNETFFVLSNKDLQNAPNVAGLSDPALAPPPQEELRLESFDDEKPTTNAKPIAVMPIPSGIELESLQ